MPDVKKFNWVPIEDLSNTLSGEKAPTSEQVHKRLSRSFGKKKARQNQLVARLKRSRGYKAPVRGGTGKQARTKRRVFTKHRPGGKDHDQLKHGRKGTGKIVPLGGDHIRRDDYYRFHMDVDLGGGFEQTFAMSGDKSFGRVEIRGWGDIVDGQLVGWLYWRTEWKSPVGLGAGRQIGHIEDIWVDQRYRRRGLATAMLKMARDLEPRVHHSKSLTEAGKKFAEVAKHKPGGVDHDQKNHGRRGLGIKTSPLVESPSKGPKHRGTQGRNGKPRREGNPRTQPDEMVYPGQCYQRAGRFMMNEVSGGEATLVHGIIRAKEGDVAHAWVILDDAFVYEGVTDAVYKYEDFTRFFSPIDIATYSTTSTLANMGKNKHFGPWDDISQEWYDTYHITGTGIHAFDSKEATKRVRQMLREQ